MTTTNDIIISVLSGILATIFMRIYDKFNNKQYTKSDYFKIGFLSCLSTLCILYLSNIVGPSLPGSNKSNLVDGTPSGVMKGGSDSNMVTKVTSVLNDNLDYFNPSNSSHTMKFKTGTPNF